MFEKIAVIGDDITNTGFKLGGIGYTFGEENLKERLYDLEKDNFGIIFITEQIEERNRAIVEDFKKSKRGVLPLVIEIPDYKGPMGKKDTISMLIKRAIGVDLVKNEE
ncbi:MAG TPA: V-type ATP synthase subunit F [Halobacteria archaeon]|jgi:vacuolar-type H+-ATPase subunit F/Vma7|nr:V-type ATP synthase subunit F [Halobacteria archaeon]